jgi:arginase
MPLAMLTGMGEQTMPEAVNLHPLPQDRILLTDGRDLDPGEQKLLESSQIMHLTEVQELLEYPLPETPLYVHFDIDILHLADAPAVSYPATGGPRAVELEAVFKLLARTGQVAAVSLSTWNPTRDTKGKSEAISLHLLETLIGSK